ncbi:hypothetical protein E2C01_095908 [Portunus trituberculatus]|uniref:Uncharacterized protein n=1 Tax=Portunus trituberculatus TaxID=210409 RepID=A0A5B7K6V4_PORTR|nr:hypothetical protein [Portunus trituberculatus]
MWFFNITWFRLFFSCQPQLEGGVGGEEPSALLSYLYHWWLVDSLHKQHSKDLRVCCCLSSFVFLIPLYFTDALVSSANKVIPVTTCYKPPTKNWSTLSFSRKQWPMRDRSPKKRKRLEWCEGFSQFTSLKDLWAFLQHVTGRKTKKSPAHPNAREEAERLILSYK